MLHPVAGRYASVSCLCHGHRHMGSSLRHRGCAVKLTLQLKALRSVLLASSSVCSILLSGPCAQVLIRSEGTRTRKRGGGSRGRQRAQSRGAPSGPRRRVGTPGSGA
jgi:hypothetical protein